ncbi:hypothetical protein [Chondrinema litorale]|uniref:hypothetical protein n=1 Tax=Chondrinema litorale TaxID=2994555 RepID=UPI00254274F1|nr:hypothetical protein [Chondrinema litorale]UZR97143.1 hypothetical protein OQ292_23890 [Chondrinema litorale]
MLCFYSWAQDSTVETEQAKNKLSDSESTPKFYFGGSFGYTSGESSQLVISPEIGYQILPYWQLGLGLSLAQNEVEGNNTYNYGGRLFSRLQPKEKLPFLQVEYTVSYLNDSLENTGKPQSSGLIGLGYPIPIGKKVKLNLIALKNITSGEINFKDDWSLRAGIISPVSFGKSSMRNLFSWKSDTARFSNKPFKERITLGGTMNFSMPSQMGGSNKILTNTSDTASTSLQEMSLSVSPTIMYEALRGFYVGTGPSIQYNQQTGDKDTDLNLGFKGFIRYKSIPILPYLQFEYAGISSSIDSTNSKKWNAGLLFGGGYNLKVGSMGSIDISMMRQLNWKNTALQASPWALRLGFNAQLGSGGTGGISSIQDLSQILTASLQKVLKKVNFEGSLSVSTGDPAKVSFTPTLNIPIDSVYSLGIGLIYQFEQDSLDMAHRNNEQYGGKLYFRYQPKPLLPYAQIEYNGIHVPTDLAVPGDVTVSKSYWEHALLLGTGYQFSISKKASFGLTVLRNLTYQGKTATYNSPWVVQTTFSSKLAKPEYKIRSGKTMPDKKQETNYLIGDIFKLEGTMSISLASPSVVDLSPQLTYYLKDWWTIGAGPVFHYQYDKDNDNSQTIYGARMTSKLLMGKGYPYGQVELESLKGQSQETVPREWHTAFLAGVGVNFPIGKKSTLNIAALRDITWQANQSLRNDPWVIRMGLGI